MSASDRAAFRLPALRRMTTFSPLLWLVAAAVLGAGGHPPDDMDVPVAQQVPLLTRVLSFDRALGGAAPLVVAVVYQERNRASRQAYREFAQTLAARGVTTVQGRPLRVVPVPVGAGPSVRAPLDRAGADVAYVAPLQGLDVRALAEAASRGGVLTLTGVRRYVDAGVAVGVGRRGGRPEILLNRRAAAAAGADLSSRLLQLATIVDGTR